MGRNSQKLSRKQIFSNLVRQGDSRACIEEAVGPPISEPVEEMVLFGPFGVQRDGPGFVAGTILSPT